jgi:uncharacterized protein (TIGR04255 family)
MSKLKNAPLLEVIFELRWKITNQADLSKCQYLNGDLYSLLKNDYQFRESLAPPEVPNDLLINSPVHRFRRSANSYPLFQVGPGILTLNTIDEFYFWDEYFIQCEQLLDTFITVYPFEKGEKFKPSLVYYDFFKVDTNTDNVLDFINKNLAVKMEQGFYSTDKIPTVLNWGITYKTDLGQLAINLNTGKNSKQEEGIILQTKLIGEDFEPNTSQIISWIGKSHDFCSQLFKDMTTESFYDSFK